MSISYEEARRISKSGHPRSYSDEDFLKFIDMTNDQIRAAAERGYFKAVSSSEDEWVVKDARLHFEELGFKVVVDNALMIRYFLEVSWHKRSWKERLLEWFGGNCQ